MLQVLTKDSVTVSVDAVVYYRVSNATVSIANVENAHHSTPPPRPDHPAQHHGPATPPRDPERAREHLPAHEGPPRRGHRLLGHQRGARGDVSVPDPAFPHCSFFCSKDVRLPIQLQRAMAAEAEAAREARAKVIAAEGEQKASRALREASEVIGDSPAALQLRYLQVGSMCTAVKASFFMLRCVNCIIARFTRFSCKHR
jgi:hypothetical protein